MDLERIEGSFSTRLTLSVRSTGSAMELGPKNKARMPQLRLKIGDVFAVKLDEHTQKFFQYIANDLTQLNSDVIRAFRQVYPIGVPIDLKLIVGDDVDFFAHVILR